MQKQAKTLNGRQTAFLIYQHFKVSESEGFNIEFSDLLKIKLSNDSLSALYDEWSAALQGMSKLPDDASLESLLRDKLHNSQNFKECMTLYNKETMIDGKPRSHERLLALLRTQVEFMIKNLVTR